MSWEEIYTYIQDNKLIFVPSLPEYYTTIDNVLATEWKDNQFFNPYLRFFGTKEELAAALSQSSQEELENGLGFMMDRELYESYRMDSMNTAFHEAGQTMSSLIYQINPANTRNEMSEKKRARTTKTKDMQDKIFALNEGYVLDVSKMNENGTGARTVKRPAGRSAKKGTDNLPIISDNYVNYKRAVLMLSRPKDYEEDLRAMAKVFGVKYDEHTFDGIDEFEVAVTTKPVDSNIVPKVYTNFPTKTTTLTAAAPKKSRDVYSQGIAKSGKPMIMSPGDELVVDEADIPDDEVEEEEEVDELEEEEEFDSDEGNISDDESEDEDSDEDDEVDSDEEGSDDY